MAAQNTAESVIIESAGTRRYNEIRRVTVAGAWINALLAALKLAFGYLAHSQALIADGLHSLSDLASDFLLLFAAKHATRDADEDHPYGLGASRPYSASCKAPSLAPSRWVLLTMRANGCSIPSA